VIKRIVNWHRSTTEKESVKGYWSCVADKPRERFINALAVSYLSTPIAKPLRNESSAYMMEAAKVLRGRRMEWPKSVPKVLLPRRDYRQLLRWRGCEMRVKCLIIVMIVAFTQLFASYRYGIKFKWITLESLIFNDYFLDIGQIYWKYFLSILQYTTPWKSIVIIVW